MSEVIPVSGVIATRNRAEPLRRTLESLAAQSVVPAEVIIVDGSDGEETAAVCGSPLGGLRSRIVYLKAAALGAAVQRNQGVKEASQPVIWFADDDILLEPDCLSRLYAALGSDPSLGGVNAMITNQQYGRPGRVARSLYAVLDGRRRDSYAGRCVGPGFALLPEDRDDLPDVVPVDWLNAGCTLYRREVLPDPPFDSFFYGYSLGEDTALSLRVAKQWSLGNARTARIYHDSQPGDHKRGVAALAEMELVNRHYIMTEVLQRRRLLDYFRLGVLQTYHVVATARSRGGLVRIPAFLWGKLRGLARIVTANRHHPAASRLHDQPSRTTR